MATIRELDDGGPDGSRLGRTTTNLVSLWGATPVVQPSGTNQAAVVSTAIVGTASTSVTTSTSVFGFTTSTQANSLLTAVNSLVTIVNSLSVWANQTRTDLVAVGIQKGSV